ncbi:ferrochelatase [Ktedonobacter sp. SOSP1-52]|uniref:ferrochelatase n=1 Tax=Ktedonobacter sp. SOSP1-52 TaxID=2778366 RepID=UPI001916396A|nr:ferrochelatase [Ktedonobacter sp. SOSP1-52]GHO68755.1 ferrochelatase [Ktedonobacter sp. SOSP1-52]
MAEKHIGVLLMTYGSPSTLDEVPEYMRNVRGGREPEPDLVVEFRRRYDLIGGSPLVRITREQAAALQGELNKDGGDAHYRVDAGMRFSRPFISEVMPEVASNADELVGIVMSPQFSPIIMGGYVRTINEAAAQLGRPEMPVRVAGDWHLQPLFIQALAERVRQALDEKFAPEERDQVPVLLTAHSMPKRVIENEPNYINNLKETAAAVAKEVGLADDRWMFCYQSAGHTPEEWLKPDFADIMPELEAAGRKHVLIAPVQFLADHLEILYDIEVGAREQAEEHNIHFARIESLNTSPLFIKALAQVVRETL